MRSNALVLPAAVVLLALAGCQRSSDVDAGPTADGGLTDTGTSDAAIIIDAGVDAGVDAAQGALCCGPWCWSNPLPQGNSLNAVFATSPTDVWAVGDHGTALHFNGTGWSAEPVSPELNLMGVWAASSAEVWATAGRYSWDVRAFVSGAVLQRDGGGWGMLDLPTALSGISGTSASDIWVAQGAFEPRSIRVPTRFFGGDGGYHFDGASWQPGLAPGPVTSLWATSANDVWTMGPTVNHWDGVNWSPVPSLSYPQIQYLLPSSVWASGPNDAWALQATRSLSHWDGVSWTTDLNTITQHDRLWGSARDDVWLAGDGVPILHFDGGTWAPTPTIASVLALGGTSRTDAWAVGGSGTLLHWDGAEWRLSSRNAAGPSGFTCNALWGTAPNDLWAVGDAILHGDGGNWTQVITGQENLYAHAVWGSSSSDVWVVGGSEARHWNGVAWSSLSLGEINPRVIWGTSASDVWVGGNRAQGGAPPIGRLSHWDGTRWNAFDPATLPPDFYPHALWGTSANDLWIVNSGSKLLHWDGVSWTVATTFPGTKAWFGSATDIWTNDGSQFLHWDGQRWSGALSPFTLTTEIVGFAGSGPQDVWALGFDSAANTSVLARWRGTQWEIDPLPGVPFLSAIWVSAQGDVWLCGEDSAILHRQP